MEPREKLEKEIADLEKKLAKDHFGGIVDRAGRKKKEDHLRKLKKELEKLIKEGK